MLKYCPYCNAEMVRKDITYANRMGSYGVVEEHEINSEKCIKNRLKQLKPEPHKCLIYYVEEDFVFVSTEENELLQISCEELKKTNIQCKIGTTFMMKQTTITINEYENVEQKELIK